MDLELFLAVLALIDVLLGIMMIASTICFAIMILFVSDKRDLKIEIKRHNEPIEAKRES